MRILKIGLGSLAEAAHLVVSAVQAAGPGFPTNPDKSPQPGPPLPDLSLVKLQINVRGGRPRAPASPSGEEA